MSKKSPQEESLDNLPDSPPKDNRGAGKQDEEVLVISRIHRLLAKLPDDGTRSRVINYLYSRYVQALRPLLADLANAGTDKS